MSTDDGGPSEDGSTGGVAPVTVPEVPVEVPVLRDVVTPVGIARAPARRLDRDARAALGAEAAFLLDEVLDECLPELEARLRERLEQRLREWLDTTP